MFLSAFLSMILSCNTAADLDSLAAGVNSSISPENARELRIRALAVADNACDTATADRAEELAFDLGVVVGDD